MVACVFNTFFFTTVAASLVDKLPNVKGRFGPAFLNSYYKNKHVTPDAFEISPASEERVRLCLSSLSTNKASGLDLISSRFLRVSANVISGVITHIINLSLKQGIFPSDMKKARAVPLYKKNSRTDVGNYRPVSILTAISKMFERLVYEQVEVYLVKQNLLYEFQSGFRAAHSTETCLTHLCDYIRQNFDEGNYVGMILLDLQKAFDTVNHAILLSKLQSFRNSAVKWFTSYLTGRT